MTRETTACITQATGRRTVFIAFSNFAIFHRLSFSSASLAAVRHSKSAIPPHDCISPAKKSAKSITKFSRLFWALTARFYEGLGIVTDRGDR